MIFSQSNSPLRSNLQSLEALVNREEFGVCHQIESEGYSLLIRWSEHYTLTAVNDFLFLLLLLVEDFTGSIIFLAKIILSVLYLAH